MKLEHFYSMPEDPWILESFIYELQKHASTKNTKFLQATLTSCPACRCSPARWPHPRRPFSKRASTELKKKNIRMLKRLSKTKWNIEIWKWTAILVRGTETRRLMTNPTIFSISPFPTRPQEHQRSKYCFTAVSNKRHLGGWLKIKDRLFPRFRIDVEKKNWKHSSLRWIWTRSFRV